MAPSIYKPSDMRDVAELIAWAVSEQNPLEIAGGGSKPIGHLGALDHRLDMTGFSGISLYEPEELVLRAGAGTPMVEIEAALKEHRQEMAFEPPDLSDLLGRPRATPTLGGVLASNLSGPRRIKAGAARDHFLGVEAVSGRGEFFKSGGRVVKNVTGYDMCKVLAGSWGTLAVMCEVTIKVLPASPASVTVVLPGNDPDLALAAVTRAMMSDCEPTGAAFLPRKLAKRSGIEDISGLKNGVILLRLEGIKPSVTYRANKLKRLLAEFGKTELVPKTKSARLWREIGNVGLFANTRKRAIWKISTVPGEGAACLKALDEITGAEGYFDWAGGLIWVSVPAKTDAAADKLRGILAGTTGHATLIAAAGELSENTEIFQPLAPGVMHLTARVKDGFDPARVLNPGRMYAGL
jgi:glycolate oxidase FAD binding subunit